MKKTFNTKAGKQGWLPCAKKGKRKPNAAPGLEENAYFIQVCHMPDLTDFLLCFDSQLTRAGYFSCAFGRQVRV